MNIFKQWKVSNQQSTRKGTDKLLRIGLKARQNCGLKALEIKPKQRVNMMRQIAKVAGKTSHASPSLFLEINELEEVVHERYRPQVWSTNLLEQQLQRHAVN